MSLDEDLLSLIAGIYDAAIDETLWPAAMERLLATTDSQAASFCVLDSAEQPRLSTFVYVNFHPQLIEEYLDHMAPHDPTIQHIIGHPDQKFHHDTSFISESEKDRHIYYDWHEKFSDTRHRVAGIIRPAPGIQSGVTIHRTRAKGDFDPDSLSRFTMLFSHIERALQIGFRLGTLGTLQQVSLAMLDSNPLAIVLLDRTGRLIMANRAARMLAEEADGLTLTADSISMVRRADDVTLQQLIGDALKTTRGEGTRSGGLMSALRPSGKRPFSIMVSPLSSDSFAMTTLRPAACVMIADPDKQHVLPADQLRALYGLTPSESRLAAQLTAGADLRASAAGLGITYATARTQLAAIFRKTETSRQGELIKLLLSTVQPPI
jgi:DNA-binding CsgD family transcriptional regulator